MNIEEIIKLLSLLDKTKEQDSTRVPSQGLVSMMGQKVIIRTYSAGVWFGHLDQKAGNEVILSEARRMWRWKAAKSISLSACALYGIDRTNSKIVAPVNSVWLEAIEILPCSPEAVISISGANHVEAE